MAQEDQCRIAVYDKCGNFLGYKSDTFWTLTKKPNIVKIHPEKDCGLEGHLMNNLLHFSNNPEELLRGLFGIERRLLEEGYRINVEKVGDKRTPNDVIAKYQVMKDSTGKYVATHRSE